MDCSPWGSSVHGDSPGKNSGVGCHALFQGVFPTQGSNPGGFFTVWAICEWVSESLLVVSDSLWPHGLYSPWNSPGQNTGIGSLFLLQGIFRTQGSNPGLPHRRQTLYCLSHLGSQFLGCIASWQSQLGNLAWSGVSPQRGWDKRTRKGAGQDEDLQSCAQTPTGLPALLLALVESVINPPL